MKIGLIFCPFRHKKFEEDLRVVSDEFGVYPPMGLAYVAAILEKEGHEVIIVDANALRLSKEETLDKIDEFSPDILGFMLTTYMFHDTLDWIKFFKRKTELPIVVGNINLEIYPKETLSYKEIDYGINGPAQRSLPLLLDALKHNKPIENIKGVVFRKDGEVIVNPPEAAVEDFTRLPHPARHLLPNEKYYQFISKRKNFTLLITSKGCPYRCNFCAVTKIPYTERPIDDVMKEIEECYYRFGVREIDFFEPTFTVNKKRVMKICNRLIKKKLDLHWSCRSRVDHADERLIRKMSKAGCKRIYYGVESGDVDILNNESKGITLQQTRDALRLCKKYKIKTLGFLMVGQPGETRENVEKTIKFVKTLGLDYIQVGRTIAKPGTPLHEHVIKDTKEDFWKRYILKEIEEKRCPSPWSDMTEKDKFDAAKRLYYQHYINPRYVIKTILEIRSFAEFKRYFKAGLKFMFGNQKIDLADKNIDKR